jgi:hypothetical protein
MYLLVKKDGEEVLNLELSRVLLNGNELTLAIKEQNYKTIGLNVNSVYTISVVNETENLSIPEEYGIYRSYTYSVSETVSSITNEDGTITKTTIPFVSANQLLFTTL